MKAAKGGKERSRKTGRSAAVARESREPQRRRSDSRAEGPLRLGLLASFILVATLLAYVPAMRGGFVWDDDDYVTNNETLRSVEGLRRIWIPGETTQYYPAVYTSFWVEYQIWKLDPTGYHVVNVLLHASGALLLWMVLRRLSIRGAWLAALIFALHPVHVESVAWITERKNVLSGVFAFATLLAYLRFETWRSESSWDRRSWGHYGLALALYVLALFSKTVVCTLPAAMCLLLWWKRRLNVRSAMPLLPMFALGAFLATVTARLELHEVGARGAEWSLTILERFLLAGRVLWFYFAKLVWPIKVNLIYYRWQIDASVWWQYLFPLAAGAVVLWLWQVRERIGRGALVAALYFAGTLAPALGFFNVYFMRYSYVADHFQYLASIGPITGIAFLLTRYAAVFSTAEDLGWRDEASDRITVAASNEQPEFRELEPWVEISLPGHVPIAILIAALAVLTWNQGKAYRNVESLWRDTLSKNEQAWIAHGNLANVLMDQRKYGEAEQHLQRALQLKPDYAEAHQSMGMVHAHRGEFDEAIRCFRERLRLKSPSPVALSNLGMALAQTGNEDEAAEYFLGALRLDSGYGDAHFGLGLILAKRGAADEAARHFRRAIQGNPENVDAYFSLGVLLARTGEYNAAASAFRETLRLAPDHAEAKRALQRLQKAGENPGTP